MTQTAPSSSEPHCPLSGNTILNIRPSKSRRLQGLAYHEATHAVLAHLLGAKIHEIWIDAEQQDGQTILTSTLGAREVGLIAIAGGMGQARFDESTIHRGHGRRPPALLGDVIKLREALLVLAKDDEPLQDQLRLEWRREVADLISNPDVWTAIEIVARALAEKRRLTATEFGSIVPSDLNLRSDST